MVELCIFLLVFLWLQLPPKEFKAHNIVKTRYNLFQIPHEYYQTGDIIIGAITTQLACLFDEIYFNERPRTKFANEFL